MVVSVAIKNLAREKTRLVMSSSGVAFSILLIVAVVGIYNAIDAAVGDSIMNVAADLWVSSEGSSGSLHSPSVLSMDLIENLRRIEGVRDVKELVRTGVSIEMNGGSTLIYLTGYDVDSGIGGPWKIARGASKPGRGEAIVDKVLAAKNDLDIGDNIKIIDREFKIVGLSEGTALFITYMVFIPFEDAITLRQGEIVNYFLISTNASTSPKQVATSIDENIVGVSVLTSEELANSSKREILGGFLPIIFVIVTIGLVVGIVVVGLAIYTLTVERSREYGILKAIGTSNRRLYAIVVEQALIVSILGFLAGWLLSGAVLYITGVFVPELVVLITAPMMLWVLLLVLVMGIIASYLPIRRVAKVDPAVVFKT